MNISIKNIPYKKDTNSIRQDLLNMRFAKAQKKNFSPAKYRKTRRELAKHLTKLNSQSKKEKEKSV